MEDPWGGDPWSTADDGNALHPDAAAAAAKLGLPTAPRQAHFAADGGSRGSSPRRVLAAPWGRELEDPDDAWGGWNAGAESPGWGRSPGIKPAAGAAVREPSPDPWGGLGSTKRTDVEEEPSGRREERTADSAISLGEDDTQRRDTYNDGKVRRSSSIDERAHDIWGVDVSAVLKEAAASDPADGPGEVVDEIAKPDTSEKLTCGEDGSREVATSDEPLEEDRKPSKVQELVEMFDGIAHRNAASSEALSTSTKEPTAIAVDTDVALQVPDIQVAEAFDEELQHEGMAGSEDNEEVDKSAPEPTAGDEDQKPLPDTEQRVDSGSRLKLPPVPFPIDLTQLDRLFPSTPSTSVDPEPVPDVIIDDTFASVSERKAWYHVSRFGSIRKYNGGGGGDDDDGYVRVSWAGSHVRDKTLRIVRRWMEEDSIGGRVVLGRRLGAGGGGNLFNWDSEAPPVEIGELLRAKKSKGAAAGVGGHGRQASAVVRGSVMSPTEPAFAWSSSSLPSSPLAARQPELMPMPDAAEHKQSQDAPPVEPKQSLERPASLQLPRPPEATPATRQPLSPLTQSHPVANDDTTAEEEDEDEDDEWGEMVSPETAAQPEPSSTAPSLPAPLDVNASHTTTIAAAAATPLDRASVIPPDDTDESTLLPSTEIHIKAAPSRTPNDPWAAQDSDWHDSSSSSSAEEEEGESQHTLVTTITHGAPSSSDLDPWDTSATAASPLPVHGAPEAGTPKPAAAAATRRSPVQEPPTPSLGPSNPADTPFPLPPASTTTTTTAATASLATRQTATTTKPTIAAAAAAVAAAPPAPGANPPIADDQLVADILRNLPDLSYMLH
ncbi:hypothetical protein JDV02_004972 [Purpureocillium takamizusanense]|uniref:Uncharacterized protein n=1 Tax=Purpureocillium takamizusanense TaxID=2060973 RepID=A0A9Q8QGZ7_9HYPO|nr:uncharacterized protein JDV02_004972 [Purpureocillium takamizusanense]UNI18719.1 hypothetical protein JDV02_004972 [Purpureocillium takamizusanense]